jgi:hypothetical protein
MESAMLKTILTALVTAFVLTAYFAAGTAVYVIAGMPGMSAMHQAAEYKAGRVGGLVNEQSWTMHRTNRIESETATPKR